MADETIAKILQAGAFSRQQAEALLKFHDNITLTSAQIIAALGYTPADAALTLTAGAGLIGGGDLTANRSFAIDPAVLTAIGNALPLTSGTGTSNAVTGAGHTHQIDATTVGAAFLNLANPSAIRFPRINADNSVSALDAAAFRTAIGAAAGTDLASYVLKAGDTMSGKLIISNAAGIAAGHLSMRVGANTFDMGMGYASAADPTAYLINRVSGANIAYSVVGAGQHLFSQRLMVSENGTAPSNTGLAGTNVGLQVNAAGASGRLLAYNYTSLAYQPINYDASAHNFNAGVTVTGTVQSNTGIMRAQGFGGASDAGVYYFGDSALDNFIYKQSGTNAFIFRIGTVPVQAVLDAGGTILTTTGNTNIASALGFGSGVASSPSDVSRHINLYGGTYGISITGNRLNYVANAGARHTFVVGGSDSVSIGAPNASDTLLVPGSLRSTGSGAILHTYDRTTSRQWGWYGTGDIFRLWNGSGDIMTMTTAGVATATNWVASSDARLKRDIIEAQLYDQLLELTIYDYRWRKSGERGRSALAQHVQRLAPAYVHENPMTGELAIDTGGLALEVAIIALRRASNRG